MKQCVKVRGTAVCISAMLLLHRGGVRIPPSLDDLGREHLLGPRCSPELPQPDKFPAIQAI